MADKPKRYCAVYPCPNYAEPNSNYCAEHQPIKAVKVRDQFYGTGRWRRFRDWYIGKQPLCEQCLAEGRIEPAVIVDHIIELKDGGAPLSEDNAMSLCRRCHQKKTAREAALRRENHRVGNAIDRPGNTTKS